jgi:hypothetical protein
MQENCKKCGKKLEDPNLTHCSNKCLLTQIQNSQSLNGIPIETWHDGNPWI